MESKRVPNLPSADILSRTFERQVQQMPNAPALIEGDRTITYAALNQRANQLAHYLQHRGAGPERVIGVCIPRSIDMVIALLAVIKAGSAYLALDVSNPRERSSFMLRDAGALALLTRDDSDWEPDAREPQVISLSEHASEIARESSDDLSCAVTNDHLFKIVYTSGSTGRPKGVLIPGHAVMHRMNGMAARFPFQPSDIALLHRSCMIGGSSWDCFGPLVNGVPTVIVQRFDPTHDELWHAVLEARVSHVSASPALWDLILNRAETWPSGWPTLRLGTIGGEPTDVTFVERWCRIFPQATLANIYGSTECIYPVGIDIEHAPREHRHIAAGTPFPGITLQLLDHALKAVPQGSPGDLYISGRCVARGYLNAPALTAEKFIPDPTGPPGGRMFKTGDRALMDAAGILHVIGREDDQVKISGYRVELGEVEASLRLCEDVKQAVALVKVVRSGEQQLVGFVVPTPGTFLTTKDVRHRLASILPGHMIPQSLHILRELPLTPQGKVDRHKLLEMDAAAARAMEPIPPGTATEAAIAAIWVEVLDIPQVGINEDFLELGGESISAMRAAARISESLNVSMAADMIFEAGCIKQLAEWVDATCLSRFG